MVLLLCDLLLDVLSLVLRDNGALTLNVFQSALKMENQKTVITIN